MFSPAPLAACPVKIVVVPVAAWAAASVTVVASAKPAPPKASGFVTVSPLVETAVASVIVVEIVVASATAAETVAASVTVVETVAWNAKRCSLPLTRTHSGAVDPLLVPTAAVSVATVAWVQTALHSLLLMPRMNGVAALVRVMPAWTPPPQHLQWLMKTLNGVATVSSRLLLLVAALHRPVKLIPWTSGAARRRLQLRLPLRTPLLALILLLKTTGVVDPLRLRHQQTLLLVHPLARMAKMLLLRTTGAKDLRPPQLRLPQMPLQQLKTQLKTRDLA
mmetsp:Transcript_6431/g.13038  ORF Transcript_6431/g.13038 Transcript_6431/m.13038 type:complete len:278 (+) Transcript_6431:538-1371(+)